MLRVSHLRGFNRVPLRGPLSNAFSSPLNGVSSGWVAGTTFRQFMDPWATPRLRQWIRLGFQFPTNGTHVSSLYVGVADTPNVANAGFNLNARSLFRVTWNNGQTDINPGSSGTAISDIIPILWPMTTPLLFSWYQPDPSSVSNVTGLTGTPSKFWYATGAGDLSGFKDVSTALGSFAPTGQAPYPMMLISSIDLGDG